MRRPTGNDGAALFLYRFVKSSPFGGNDDDRRQWRIEGGVVGAVASKVRVQLHEAAAGSHNLGWRTK